MGQRLGFGGWREWRKVKRHEGGRLGEERGYWQERWSGGRQEGWRLGFGGWREWRKAKRHERGRLGEERDTQNLLTKYNIPLFDHK